jgi:hypothetical protein
VNVSEDYPYADFEGLYFNAWKSQLKGLATYRPNSVLGSVLSVEPALSSPTRQPDAPTLSHNTRLLLDTLPAPVLASLRWPGRPDLPDGNDAWTYMIESSQGRFALFVGHIAEHGKAFPFEVWVNGTEQPRGLGAVAKTLSMDMRTNDRGWLALKLDAMTRTVGEEAFDMRFPPTGETRRMPSVVSAIAQIIRYRCDRLRVFDDAGGTSVIDAMFIVDRRCRQSRRRRRICRGPEGNHPARWGDTAVFTVAVRPLPARPRWPLAHSLARHAGDGSGVDRHEIAEASQLCRTAGRLHGLRSRRAPPAELALHRRLCRAAIDPSLHDARRAG